MGHASSAAASSAHRTIHVALLAAVLVAPAFARSASASPAASPAAGSAWERLERLADVRYEHGRELAPQIRASGSARVALPWSFPLDGQRFGAVDVGPGWVDLIPAGTATASLTGGPSAEGDRRPPLRLTALGGPGVGLSEGSDVRVITEGDGVAVRWAPLGTPLGPAVLELLLDRSGRATVQYLHLPAGLDTEAPGSPFAAGTAAQPLAAASATAFRLGRGQVLVPSLPPQDLPPGHVLASGPPPPNCNPTTEDWCELADGPGPSAYYINEFFDDGLSASRGWSGTDEWHEIPYSTCSPGATLNPGRSWYFGQDTNCKYAPLGAGSLFSPVVGPITANTQMVFSSRIGAEGRAADGTALDIAQIYVNGTLIGDMPYNLDPTLWYNFNPINLSAFAGQSIQVEFRFQANDTNQRLGWMVDDVVVWDPTVGNPDCTRNAGHAGYDPCSQRLSTQWDFNEGRFCAGCQYTFYVLVECGREMHLPLEDMEGADVKVTDMVTGAPVPLHCINQTAVADAGGGAYRGYYVPSTVDGTGAPRDCCGGNGVPEVWWSPALDVTDSAGPGHVRWGLDEGCPIYRVYDLNGDTNIDCGPAELPGTCGGVLPLVSPGEQQTMDCSIKDDAGLCGLYRIDIASGGYGWSLFANCDGTNTPQFPIYYDCTDAWAAYNPLPELAIANLVTANGCPNLTVSYDVVNLGCIDQVGDVLTRISSNCVPADTLDHVVTGGIPAGGRVTVSVPFAASCTPVRIQVAADPDNTIAECTESATVASCRAEQGVDSLATFTCGCTAQLTAAAGADRAGCAGDVFTLDGGASTIAPCASPQYKWVGPGGIVLRDWSSVKTVNVTATCPGGTYTLLVRCAGEACTEMDDVRVVCQQVTATAGADVIECVGDPLVLSAAGSTVTNCAQLEYRWFDELGREVLPWSTSPILDLGTMTCPAAGTYQAEVRCAGSANCSGADDVVVKCVQVLANAGRDLSTCEGQTFTIDDARSVATNCRSVIYAWFDNAMPPNQLTPFGPDPTFQGTLANCPGTVTLLMAAVCNDPGFVGCGTIDSVDVSCTKPQPPVPAAITGCANRVDLFCGTAEPGVTYLWDLDITVDDDGDGDPANDTDLIGCNVTATFPAAGTHAVRITARDGAGCLAVADLPVDSFADPTVAPTAVPGCAGAASLLHCGSADPGAAFSWDADVAVDSDANGTPDDDADATGCDPSVTYGPGSHLAKVTVTDVRGCTASATVLVDVAGSVPLPEVVGELVSRAGAALTMTWPAVAGAVSYDVSRGTIGTWYDHGSDPATGQGACGVASPWTDADDAGSSVGSYYYLVAAVDACGLRGDLGAGWNGRAPVPRPAPMPACP